MWSVTVYDLRLHPNLFWSLTYRQYDLLAKRHREAVLHRELIAAYTTAAVVNHSFCAPEEPVPVSRYMPHWKAKPVEPETATEEELEAKPAFDGGVMQLVEETKQFQADGTIGPMLRSMGYAPKEAHAEQLG